MLENQDYSVTGQPGQEDWRQLDTGKAKHFYILQLITSTKISKQVW